MKLRSLFKLLQETFQEWQKDKASQLAAALAYYTVFSIAPLLIIAIAIAGSIFGREAARGEIFTQLQELLGSKGAQVIQSAIDNANQPDLKSFASLISVAILLLGASGVFAALQDSLNQIWNVKPKPEQGILPIVRKRLLSFAMVLAIGFLLLLSLIVSAALAALSHFGPSFLLGFDFLWQILNFLISFGFVSFLFALIYKYLPDVKITWRDVSVGAIITALLFTIGKHLLGLYLGNSSFGSTYGAAGSLVVFLVWVYYSSQILLFGAEFTQVYARRYGSQIRPNRHAQLSQ
ncbi:ribonuclease BN [Hydrococcus rivularis NIES-593]|uniref:Ribonuclease BN n=1 Tax=Hydrococcus rivularis NIES-593 TaxID=1921803 RepID=A0A1U7HRF6_9CYAN|nr:YihY/virulence factor BrkB family protein [Hydrococcus rivularis]OKH26176.1 ribonuclease BN [Hydrococcus rivularis NIES-593]